MKLSFRKDLHIATIKTESPWNKFRVHTLLQNCESKQPSINAYLGARYSRSADSMVDIASEIIKNNTDAADRLEKIFSGYGHKSVGDMADLFVCIENIPMYTAMKIFYMCSVVAGQERSTRYQNFQEPQFVKIPREVCDSNEVSREYERIILKQMKDYRELLRPTKDALEKFFRINKDSQQEEAALKSRSFDVARYLLPYGLNTSSAYLMSARSWSDLISYLCASDTVVENEISTLLLNLLGESSLEVRGYIREADGLIRHTDANCCRKSSTGEVLNILKKDISLDQITNIPESELEGIKVVYSPDCMEVLISHYEHLINPLGSLKEYEFSENDQEDIGEILFEEHNHHNMLGNIGQSGGIKIEGFATLGTLKDLNRHRSLERFIPLLHEQVDMDQELGRRNDQCFYLCNYLDIGSLNKLKKEYSVRLEETYERIKNWRNMAKDVLSKEVCDEFTKYLLPHAHATKYIFYGSFDDLQYIINLRTRNGGHIAYRKLVYEWLRSLSYLDPLWRPLLRRIIEPLVDDKHQFVDRS
jgi:thymidylate synthase ThyX